MKKHLVILGAGPCGLYAALTALKKGLKVTLIEKEESPGGLAAGHKRGGNFYDLGVHMLHAFDREVFEDCASAMGDKRIEVPLKAHIKWAGKLYHYPLRGRDILSGIPPLTLARCLIGLGLAECKNRFNPEQGPTAEDALQEIYGAPLYEAFFETFTERYWGIHPRDLSAEFVRRKMPRLSAVDVLKNALQVIGLSKPQDSTEGALRFETLHYSQQGANELPQSLARHIQALGGEMLLGEKLIQLDIKSGTAVTHVGREVSGDAFLSTLPLSVLVRSMYAPTRVIEAASKLRSKPMVVFGLLVKKTRCMEALYTYYRDKSFHRVGEPKNAGLVVTPNSHTILIVEKTCEVGDDAWEMSSELLDQIYRDLEEEGLCSREDVVECHQLQAVHAYPIFELGFEVHLGAVQAFLDNFQNLRSTGRQGAFTYPNMHGAMRMGADAVHELFPD